MPLARCWRRGAALVPAPGRVEVHKSRAYSTNLRSDQTQREAGRPARAAARETARLLPDSSSHRVNLALGARAPGSRRAQATQADESILLPPRRAASRTSRSL